MATDKEDQVTQTEQNILNKSQDTTFKVLAFEMLGYEPVWASTNHGSFEMVLQYQVGKLPKKEEGV